MKSVYRDYTRARTDRKRKAILYSAYVVMIALVVGLSFIQALLGVSLTWVIVWGLGTAKVKHFSKIHTPGEQQ